MLLAIDVGNTNIVVGVFDGERLVRNWRLATDYNRSADEIGLFFVHMLNHSGIKAGDISDVIVSSVVPQVMLSLELAVRSYLKRKPIVVGPGIKTGINIRYDNPKEVGADRIVNAVAAHTIYGGPAIVIDFGTATTFCAIEKNADYLGGVIYPGIEISLNALTEHAAKLPKIELERPARVIGKNTKASIQSGVVYGYAGLIEKIVGLMKEEMAGSDIKVIATGGMAPMISEVTSAVDILDPNLTLKGLKIIYDKNSLS